MASTSIGAGHRPARSWTVNTPRTPATRDTGPDPSAPKGVRQAVWSNFERVCGSLPAPAPVRAAVASSAAALASLVGLGPASRTPSQLTLLSIEAAKAHRQYALALSDHAREAYVALSQVSDSFIGGGGGVQGIGYVESVERSLAQAEVHFAAARAEAPAALTIEFDAARAELERAAVLTRGLLAAPDPRFAGSEPSEAARKAVVAARDRMNDLRNRLIGEAQHAEYRIPGATYYRWPERAPV